MAGGVPGAPRLCGASKMSAKSILQWGQGPMLGRSPEGEDAVWGGGQAASRAAWGFCALEQRPRPCLIRRAHTVSSTSLRRGSRSLPSNLLFREVTLKTLRGKQGYGAPVPEQGYGMSHQNRGQPPGPKEGQEQTTRKPFLGETGIRLPASQGRRDRG